MVMVMLAELQRVVQEVNAAKNLDEALSIIVRRVKEAMTVDICSVYLRDTARSEYVLMATDGLNPAAVGKVRLRSDQGLVSLVGERQEPVSLSDASDHPRYLYVPETSEEFHHSFLGVPIIHYRRVLGVLVAQHQAKRLFHDDEVAFFLTVAAQLAGGISHAAAIRTPGRQANGGPLQAGYIQGVRGAPGVAIGTITLADPLGVLESVPDRRPKDPHKEEHIFREAVATVQHKLRVSGERMSAHLPAEEQALFDVFVMLLGSDTLVSDTVRRIHEGNWAPAALRDTITEHAQVFESLEDPYLQARAEDIRGLGRRILMHLQPTTEQTRSWPEHCVLVGDELSVAQIADVPIERLVGIACVRGSAVSHVALLARAMGIPAVTGLDDLTVSRLDDQQIVVDGYQGRVFIEPSAAVLREFERLAKEEREISAGLEELRDLPAETPDGKRLPMHVNTGLLSDITPSLQCGADGVGLYRTEFPFMLRESFPLEDEQTQNYRAVLESFAPRSVTMRTLDIGGDKSLPYFPVAEDNPFLGWRGIRFTLDHPEIFLTQLRAMLRANAELGNLQLLLPMVSCVEEVDEATALLARAHQELQEEGHVCPMPKLGLMIETPSAVYQIRALTGRVDFLSLGTNDLTQYLLAVDRNNARVANLYDSLHPAVLRACVEVIETGHAEARPVSVCGEMAGDPAAIPLLLGAGVDTLSMSASAVPRAKWVIRSMTLQRSRELLEKALAMEDARTIRQMMDGVLDAAGLGGLVRAGK